MSLEWVSSWMGSFFANLLSNALAIIGLLKSDPKILAAAIVLVGTLGPLLQYLAESGRKRRKR